ncbi:MAG: cytochrome c biogenesis protein CcsA [Planctomycetota bacterium]
MPAPHVNPLPLMLIGGAALASVSAGWAGLARLRGKDAPLRWVQGVAVTLSAVALVAHMAERGNWLPMRDNFDALLCLALFAIALPLHVGLVGKRFGWLDATLPVVAAVLLVAAGVFGATRPQDYHLDSLWHWVHRVSSYGGAAAFALAAAGGTAYLVLRQRLRDHADPLPGLGSLSNLERVTFYAAVTGFALLTVGLLTGVWRWRYLGDAAAADTKITLAVAAWVVYLLVLHAPLHPRFRGRAAASLSIAGFVVMLGVLVTVQFM